MNLEDSRFVCSTNSTGAHLPDVEEDVNVIGNAPDDNPRGIQVSDDRRQVGMDSWSNLVVQKGLPVLSAEDQVRVQLRERLRHGFLLKRGVRIRVNMAFGQTMRLRIFS
jgi:hypothetical protein